MKNKFFKKIYLIILIFAFTIIFYNLISYAETNNKETKIYMSRTIKDGVYYITSSQNSNLVVEVANGNLDNGGNIRLNTKTVDTNQKFHIYYVGNGYYKIENISSAKVVEVKGGVTDSKTPLQQYDDNNTSSQRWKICKNIDGTYNFISECSGKAMDVADGIISQESKIWQYDYNNTYAQRFKLEKTEIFDNGFDIMSIRAIGDSSKRIDLTNNSSKEGTAIQIWSNTDTLAQRFQLQRVGENEVRIRTASSGGYLKESSNNVGASVIQSGNSKTQPSDSDTWKVEYDKGILFINKESGLALTINGNYVDGAKIEVNTKTETEKQRFIVRPEDLISQGYYNIQSKYGTMLDISNNSQGTHLQTWSATGTSRQIFQISHDANGYKLSSPITNYVVDIYDGSKDNAAPVQMERDAGTLSQRFTAEIVDGGYVKFRNVNSKLMLNVHLFNTNPGAVVNQGIEDYSDAQKWKLIPTEFNEFSMAWGDEWCTDKAYLSTVVDRANRIGSDTDWFIAIDVRRFRITLLHKVDSIWEVDACFNATMGYLGKNGMSHTGLSDTGQLCEGQMETNWKVTRKIPNRNGDIWFVSYIDYTLPNGVDNSQGIHNHYDIPGRGQSYSSHGCPNLTDERAKYVYDHVPIGTRVHIWHEW